MNDPNRQRHVNLGLAWGWFVFGILGLADDVLHWGLHIDKSIPVLFFISVYANFVGHLGTASANQAQVKVDEANNVDIDNSDVDVHQN